jgi:hypothetical protein
MKKIKKIELVLSNLNPETTHEGYIVYPCIVIPLKISQLKK